MPNEAAGAEKSLLDKILYDGKMVRDDSQVKYAKDLIGEFSSQVLDEAMTVSQDTAGMITSRIAQLDELISRQLNEIMHAPDFRALEATWRGLHYLVMNTETGEMLKLRLMNVTKKELLSDLEKAVEFDQSNLFKKVYEEEYGTFGGNPYSCLVGDYEFGRHPQDMALLEKLSNVAAAPMRHSSGEPRPSCSTWTASPSLPSPATSPRFSRARNSSSGGLSGKARIPVTSP